MAETIDKLAQRVGIPVDRLLAQLKDAGLSFDDPTKEISEAEKKELLESLKKRHGVSKAEKTETAATSPPDKVVLKRVKKKTLK